MAGSFSEDIEDIWLAVLVRIFEDIEDVELEPHVEAAEHPPKKRSSKRISIEDLAEKSILQPRHRMLDMSSLRPRHARHVEGAQSTKK